ncbi:MAG TPA: hypothetical protein VJ698_11630 [Noviherbaspirillum sp.]|uniref:hypothetical protein n=1 Tax=Noviherbaspirillum sp. TaxID=1926288 RepID=UPI002B47B4F6|nr:hypothetical protein [Noviherbaspirillum sp.]HJV86113.1 hypothetical protein [Noviherbaspirillum sp.]
MGKIQVGDMVAFRREVVIRCNSRGIADFRGTVTDVCDGWLFLREGCGRIRVMPASSMCKVARNGVVLELV